jgi:hypothetical protein
MLYLICKQRKIFPKLKLDFDDDPLSGVKSSKPSKNIALVVVNLVLYQKKIKKSVFFNSGI